MVYGTRMRRNDHILVTGASGFIGSHLITQMVDSNDISILTRLDPNLTRIKSCLSRLNIIQMDGNDNWIKEIKILQERYSLKIIHLATSYTDELAILESNIVMPMKIIDVLEPINDHIFFNTDTFFGKCSHKSGILPKYTQSKIEFYRKAQEECLKKNIKIINLRLEHIYGSNDNPRKFVPWLIRNLMENKERIELTQCDHVRDFLNVLDTVSAYKVLLRNIDHIDANVEISIGSGSATVVKDFVLLAKKLLNSSSELCFGTIKDREDIKWSVGDPEFLCRLGWKQNVNLEDGIQKLFHSLK